jgi:hypothetical protein
MYDTKDFVIAELLVRLEIAEKAIGAITEVVEHIAKQPNLSEENFFSTLGNIGNRLDDLKTFLAKSR